MPNNVSGVVIKRDKEIQAKLEKQKLEQQVEIDPDEISPARKICLKYNIDVKKLINTDDQKNQVQ